MFLVIMLLLFVFVCFCLKCVVLFSCCCVFVVVFGSRSLQRLIGAFMSILLSTSNSFTIDPLNHANLSLTLASELERIGRRSTMDLRLKSVNTANLGPIEQFTRSWTVWKYKIQTYLSFTFDFEL